MNLPQTRAGRWASLVLAGGVALSALVGPALMPADFGGSAARADVVVDINLFHQDLSPYGRWVRHPQYGDVWYPTNVRQGWRPYYDNGHWAYSDEYGWMWVSDLPWGWAAFHYGRWAFTDEYGWIWVPGREWGPAWVSFREAPEYIGWAPLPPEARWEPGYGFRDFDVRDDRYWSFVRPQGFLERRFDRYAYDRRDYPRIINRTKNITNITIINNRIVNRSIEVNNIERETRRRVQRVHVTDSDRPGRAVVKGNNITVYKPAFVQRDDRRSGNGTAVEKPRNNNRNDRAVNNGRSGNDSQGRQVVAPNQSERSADVEQPQQRKKKRNANVDQRQFGAPNRIEPSAGGAANVEQPQKKKKQRSNANKTVQPQQVAPPKQVDRSAGERVVKEQNQQKRRDKVQVNNGNGERNVSRQKQKREENRGQQQNQNGSGKCPPGSGGNGSCGGN